MLNYLKRHYLSLSLAIFIIAYALIVLAKPAFLDPDGFYHAKMAELFAQGDFARHFSYLVGTNLDQIYGDHHFLYHLLLVPLIKITPALSAVRLMVLASYFLLLGIVAWRLKALRAPFTRLLVLMLALAPEASVRYFLAKSHVLAIVFHILFVTALVKRRLEFQFLLAVAATYTHGSYPMLFGYVLANAVSQIVTGAGSWREKISRAWFSEWRSFAVVALGIATALVASPYFPEHLAYHVFNTFSIAFRGAVNQVRVGAEWYPMATSEIIRLLVVWVIMTGAILWLAASRRLKAFARPELAQEFFTYALISFGYFFLSLYSVRHVDFFVLFLVLAIGSFGALVLGRMEWRELWPERLNKILLTFLGGCVAIFCLLTAASNIQLFRKSFFTWNYLEKVSTILRERTKPGETIFNADWESFPMLFYWNDQFRYISGLDERFLAAKNPDFAKNYEEKWPKNGDFSSMMSKFNARFYLIDKRQGRDELYRKILSSPELSLIYQDKEAMLFELNKP